jgi:hypothetical protein
MALSFWGAEHSIASDPCYLLQAIMIAALLKYMF